ncbi:MAG: ATP-binding protein [Gaiellaceae bacterium]
MLAAAAAAALLGAGAWRLGPWRRVAPSLYSAPEPGERAGWHRYQSLVEDLPIVTYIEAAGNVGQALYVSPQIEALLGYPAERWLAGDDHFFTVLHPDDHSRIRQARAAGETRTTQEFRLIAADGSERWIHSERSTINDENGEPLYVHGLWIDLTERRELELIVRQQDRLDAVGQLAGGVAHDFNNMLLAIRGRAELAARRTDIDAVRQDLAVIEATADRSAELVRRLLAFSGRQTLQPQPIDIRIVIGELLDLVRELIGSPVAIVFAPPSAPVIAFVDRAQIEQVLVNLALNARDAMPAGGLLTIVLRDLAREPGGGDAGVLIAVSDTGTGIPPAVERRIFDPFFTTKAENGSGLGLATAHGVIQQSGGHIRVAHTAEGEGTTFEIFLPSANSPLPVAPSRGETQQPGTGDGSAPLGRVEACRFGD